jgi:hypothetical protein
MAKKKLLEDIKLKPARFYRLPGDVMRDRRFADGERLEILHAWLADPQAEALRPQIEIVLEELKARIPAQAPGHAAE